MACHSCVVLPEQPLPIPSHTSAASGIPPLCHTNETMAVQLHINSSFLLNVLHALVYKYFRKTPDHVNFPEGAWELSSQCCDAHRSLLTCICLRWTSFILGFLSMGLLLLTSSHTACLPNQSAYSFLDHWSHSPSLVPAYSSPHKVGQPVGKDAFFFYA